MVGDSLRLNAVMDCSPFSRLSSVDHWSSAGIPSIREEDDGDGTSDDGYASERCDALPSLRTARSEASRRRGARMGSSAGSLLATDGPGFSSERSWLSNAPLDTLDEEDVSVTSRWAAAAKEAAIVTRVRSNAKDVDVESNEAVFEKMLVNLLKSDKDVDELALSMLGDDVADSLTEDYRRAMRYLKQNQGLVEKGADLNKKLWEDRVCDPVLTELGAKSLAPVQEAAQSQKAATSFYNSKAYESRGSSSSSDTDPEDGSEADIFSKLQSEPTFNSVKPISPMPPRSTSSVSCNRRGASTSRDSQRNSRLPTLLQSQFPGAKTVRSSQRRISAMRRGSALCTNGQPVEDGATQRSSQLGGQGSRLPPMQRSSRMAGLQTRVSRRISTMPTAPQASTVSRPQSSMSAAVSLHSAAVSVNSPTDTAGESRASRLDQRSEGGGLAAAAVQTVQRVKSRTRTIQRVANSTGQPA